MRYWTLVILVGLILGAAGRSGHHQLLQDCGTLAWLVGLVMLCRLAWQRIRGRRTSSE